MTKEIEIKKEGQSEITLNVEDVKKYIAPNATEKELYMFINIAKSYGLNPFKREIHFIKYKDTQPGQIVVGYENYIKRAERTGLLDGWFVWIDRDKVGEKAIIEIHRKDRKYSFRWEVYRNEVDRGQSTWKTMPYFMLKKVAISQGFRLAFPEDLGGMPYTPDEINVGTSENLPKEEIVETEYSQNEQNSHSESIQQAQVDNSTYPTGQSVESHTKASQSLQFLNQQLENLVGNDRKQKLVVVNNWLENNGYNRVNNAKEIPVEAMEGLIESVRQSVEEEEISKDPLEEMDPFPYDE